MDVWNVYLGQGKHERLGERSGKGNVVWLGDFNAWSKRWGGAEGGRNKEGRMVENWLDEWGLKVGNEVGVGTRKDERRGVCRVLDLAVYGGGVKLECKVGEDVVGLDHKPLEVEVVVEGWVLEEDKGKEVGVDWEKFKGEIKVWKGGGLRLEGGRVSRARLEEVIEEMEVGLGDRINRCRGRRKWKSGRTRWWDAELENKRKEVREKEEEWKRKKGEESRREIREERKEYRNMIEEKKARYWLEYLEKLKRGEGFKFVKTDRDFMVDVPAIRNEDGELVSDDKDKGREIVRGLGKRDISKNSPFPPIPHEACEG